MTSRRSSGSSRVLSAVDPTMSANITVSWRLSASEEGGMMSPPDAGAPLDRVVRAEPQLPQNRFLGAFSQLHARQSQGSGVPHRPQKFVPLATRSPHDGQFMHVLPSRSAGDHAAYPSDW